MDSVIMTTPGNSSRLRSRLRSAATAICARNTKLSKSHTHMHRNNGKNNSNVKNNNGLTRNNSLHRSNSMNNSRFLNNNINNKTINFDKNGNQRLLQQNNVLTTSQPLINTLSTGKFTREIYNAWFERLGARSSCTSTNTILDLFNDINLYPSHLQVREMLQCAHTCRNFNEINNQQFLTFGEFCIFASELRNCTNLQRQQSKSRHNCASSKIKRSKYEVFLGGSCNPTTWRVDVAIPMLKNCGITYYNPQVSSWSPDLLAAEHCAKQFADVLFFVLDTETRCLAGMVEVAQLAAAQRPIVVVVMSYKPNQIICNEQITSQEYLDLWHGQKTLLSLIRLGHTPVFSNISTALLCAAKMVRESVDVNNDYFEELRLSHKLLKIHEAFNMCDHSKCGQLTINQVCEAYYKVTESNLSISDLKLIIQNIHEKNNHTITSINNQHNIDEMRISFDEFCSIIAEFTIAASQTDSNNVDNREWASNQQHRQYFTNNYSKSFNNITTSPSLTTYENNELNLNKSKQYDIYLGGTSNKHISDLQWRENLALPTLKQKGLTYAISQFSEVSSNYDMNVNNDDENATLEHIKEQVNVEYDLDQELRLIEDSNVLLFVISAKTRSISSMLLAAHCIGLQKYQIVLCVQRLSEQNNIILNEELSQYAIKDYNRCRTYLEDIAKRDGIPVFDCITGAIHCAIDHRLRQK